MKKKNNKADNRTRKIKAAIDQRSSLIYSTFQTLDGQAKPSLLSYLSGGKKRLTHIVEELKGLPARALASELKSLENNALIKKTEAGTMPVIIEYELTAAGQTLNKILDDFYQWGLHKSNAEAASSVVINPWKTDH